MQNIKYGNAKFHTIGKLIDYFIKILQISNINDSDRKRHQRFVKENNISLEEYEEKKNLLLDDVLDEFFEQTKNKQNQKQIIKNTILFFLDFYQELILTLSLQQTSQKQLDFLLLKDYFLPLSAIFLFGFDENATILMKLKPTKEKKPMPLLFDFIKDEINMDDLEFEKFLFDFLDNETNRAKDDLTIKHTIDNWLKGKTLPDSKNIESLSNLSIEIGYDKQEIRNYFLLAKIMQESIKKMNSYFGKDLTKLLIEYFYLLAKLYGIFNFKANFKQDKFEYLLFNNEFKNMDKKIVSNYLDFYFYNSITLFNTFYKKALDTDRYDKNERQNLNRFLEKEMKQKKIMYDLDEKSSFESLVWQFPIEYLTKQITLQELNDRSKTDGIEKLIMESKFDELIFRLYSIVDNPKNSDSKEQYLKLVDELKNDYPNHDEFPIFSFIFARYYAQNRDYKKSTHYYLEALKNGKNCIGEDYRTIIKEGLIVSTQTTREKKVSLDSKGAFTQFYKEAYFYGLLDTKPDEINNFFLNDIKKHFDMYFGQLLFDGVKKPNKEVMARNMGFVDNSKIKDIKLDLRNLNKEIKNIYPNPMTQLMHFTFLLEYDSIDKLIKAGADVNKIRFNDNATALTFVLGHSIDKKNDVIKIAKLLISKMNKTAINTQLAKKRETALSFAINKGYVEIVKLLIENDANINTRVSLDEFTPLYLVLSIIAKSINHIGNKNFIPLNPLKSKNERHKILRDYQLTTYGQAIFNDEKNTILDSNRNKEFKEIIKKDLKLLGYSNDLNAMYEIFDIVLDAKPNLEERFTINFTALIFATELNQTKLVKKLLERGANKYATTEQDYYAYHYALKNNNRELMELLRLN